MNKDNNVIIQYNDKIHLRRIDRKLHLINPKKKKSLKWCIRMTGSLCCPGHCLKIGTLWNARCYSCALYRYTAKVVLSTIVASWEICELGSQLEWLSPTTGIDRGNCTTWKCRRSVPRLNNSRRVGNHPRPASGEVTEIGNGLLEMRWGK